jgi:ubiquinone/menaquinone biosynthesis C-methylase UbiE
VRVIQEIADAVDLKAGWEVLDVACGNGNATLAAARSGAYALGIDYVPELLEGGRARSPRASTSSSGSATPKTCP